MHRIIIVVIAISISKGNMQESGTSFQLENCTITIALVPVKGGGASVGGDLLGLLILLYFS